MEKIKELIEQNRYTLYPINGQKTGIDRIELTINEITNRVDLRVYYDNEHIRNINECTVLTSAERDKLNRQTRRLNNIIKQSGVTNV